MRAKSVEENLTTARIAARVRVGVGISGNRNVGLKKAVRSRASSALAASRLKNKSFLIARARVRNLATVSDSFIKEWGAARRASKRASSSARERAKRIISLLSKKLSLAENFLLKKVSAKAIRESSS